MRLQIIKKKLHSEKGAGILYALLVLLVVAMVSSVVITAALSSSGRIENRLEDEQLYLAAESATDILANDWSGKLGCAFMDTNFKSSNPNWELYWYEELNGDIKPVPFSDYFRDLANAVLNGTEPPANKEVFVNFSENADNLSNIDITATLSPAVYTSARGTALSKIEENSEFNVRCLVTASNLDDSEISPYTIEMTLTASAMNYYKDTTVDKYTAAYANWQVTKIAQGETEND